MRVRDVIRVACSKCLSDGFHITFITNIATSAGKRQNNSVNSVKIRKPPPRQGTSYQLWLAGPKPFCLMASSVSIFCHIRYICIVHCRTYTQLRRFYKHQNATKSTYQLWLAGLKPLCLMASSISISCHICYICIVHCRTYTQL